MKRSLLFTALGLLALGAPLSADTVEGVLLDNVCVKALATPAYEAALEQSKNCRLLKDGKKKGFSLVSTDGTVLRLDPRGNGLAMRAVAASGKSSEVRVKADGKVKGERVAIDKLMLIG